MDGYLPLRGQSRGAVVARLVMALVTAVPAGAEDLLHHHSFADFSAGTFSDSGCNLYVSRAGRLRYVNLFDIDGDGFPEVVANNDHNRFETPDILVYHNRRPEGLRSLIHPAAQDAPLFQQLDWTLKSLKTTTRLPAIGGNKALLCDLNGDGYAELLFTTYIHGMTLSDFPVNIYWGGADGFSVRRRSILPGDRGTGLAVADLNGDGLADIAVSNAGREHMQHARRPAGERISDGELDEAGPRERTSYIYYQTEYGFSHDEREEIPTYFAIDVKAADLDGSGHPALIFLEQGSPGAIRILRRRGRGWDAPETVPVASPLWGKVNRQILVQDLNGDGRPDIFAPSDGARSEIFWNRGGRFSSSDRTVLNVDNAIDAAAADLDGDGFTDLVVATFSVPDTSGRPVFGVDSYIWWGSSGGFDPGRRTALPTLGASSVVLADVDGDGRLDVLFSNWRDQNTYDVPSPIYFNSPGGFSPGNRLDLQGFGAAAALAGDIDADGTTDVILVNSMSGIARVGGDAPEDPAGDAAHRLPMFIYRGNAEARFGPANLIRVPQATQQTNLAFSDMDDDGQGDLVCVEDDREQDDGRSVVIRYSVCEAAAQAGRATRIPLPFGAQSVDVADFDRDGRLDILVTPHSGPQAALILGRDSRLYEMKPFDFQYEAWSCAIGDLDNDGVLDAVTCGHEQVCIMRGSVTGGFHFEPPFVIRSPYFVTRVSLADFGDDGWLDILCQNFQVDRTFSNAVDSWILINDHGRFSESNKRTFRTYGAVGGSIARLRDDGRLDVVAANYLGGVARQVATFIFHCGEDGYPTDADKVRLPSFSAGSNLVLDFNGDGFPDIAVFNHTEANEYDGGLLPRGGNHGVGSFLYLGGPDGFDPRRRAWIPSFGPHFRISADPGSVARRHEFEDFTSPLVVNRMPGGRFRLTVTGRFNKRQYSDAALLFDDPGGGRRLVAPVAPPVQAPGSMAYDFDIPEGTRFRYRLRLHSSNSGAGPTVSDVRMAPVVR